ncbi:hypothetical protein G8C92_25290 [Paenibacillus donghaensis]|uniref:hypothetical protein n=1 Tax=Paenibacillus donghaensis TaxID=414771 RepID=UPI0018840C98|nr:hypothetical protein [Paenibacillus donghaensis]MBE9917336.1 hypothetical protein [Paenibacillus donghaensis]
MDSAVSKKVTMISYTIAISFIVAMIAASVLLRNHEIILPEIAAMAIAMWVYREAGWIRQPSKIFIAPTVTAGIGLMINQLQIAYVGKVILTLMLIMLFLRIIRSNLAPSIATGLLPLVINTHEWSFVMIVFIFTIILMIGVLAFGLNKGLEKKVSIQYKYMLIFLALTFFWISLCWVAGYQQIAVIPPILVVVYESVQKPMYNGKMAFKQGLVLTLSAAIGTLLYFTMDSWVLAALLDMILMLALSLIVGIRIPAIYAFPLLSFIFPEENVMNLPLGTLVTCLFMFTCVLLYRKYEMKRTGKSKAPSSPIGV